MMIKLRWIDRWLCSDAKELLEREGASPRGIAIIDDFNKAYQRSRVTARMVRSIVSEARNIHAATGKTVRILEIGMRDGDLLSEISKATRTEKMPVDLHGVEFRQNLVALAVRRLSALERPIQCHYAPSRDLDAFTSGDFDIVYSTFVLHHQSEDELRQLLSASFRVSRYSVIHHDLTRSLWALVLIWTFYTMFKYRTSRFDAVLSCRRAYRPNEIAKLMCEINSGDSAMVSSTLPFYWTIHKPFGGMSK